MAHYSFLGWPRTKVRKFPGPRHEIPTLLYWVVHPVRFESLLICLPLLWISFCCTYRKTSWNLWCYIFIHMVNRCVVNEWNVWINNSINIVNKSPFKLNNYWIYACNNIIKCCRFYASLFMLNIFLLIFHKFQFKLNNLIKFMNIQQVFIYVY